MPLRRVQVNCCGHEVLQAVLGVTEFQAWDILSRRDSGVFLTPLVMESDYGVCIDDHDMARLDFTHPVVEGGVPPQTELNREEEQLWVPADFTSARPSSSMQAELPTQRRVQQQSSPSGGEVLKLGSPWAPVKASPVGRPRVPKVEIPWLPYLPEQNVEPVQIGDEVSNVSRKRVPDPPKDLKFDGTGRFSSFRDTFVRWVVPLRLSSGQAVDAMVRCLKDQARDFVLDKLAGDPQISYEALLTWLGKFYGETDSKEVAREKLMEATQGKDETAQEWAMRVFSLAQRGYSIFGEECVHEHAIQRLCAGARDLQVGRSVKSHQPKRLEDAMAVMVALTPASGGPPAVRKSRTSISSNRVRFESPEQDRGRSNSPRGVPRADPMLAAVTELTKVVQQLGGEVAALKAGVKPINDGVDHRSRGSSPSSRRGQSPVDTRGGSSNRAQSPRRSGGRAAPQGCFFCGATDHFIRDCPRKASNSRGNSDRAQLSPQ